MKVKLLIGHRGDNWATPEALAVVDEVTDDENPDWFTSECKRQIDLCGEDLTAHAVIEVQFPTDAVMKALYPQREQIPAMVVPS